MAYLRRPPESKYWHIQWVVRDPITGKRVWHSRSTGEENYDKAMKMVEIFDDAQNRRNTADRMAAILRAAGSDAAPVEVELVSLWGWYVAHCDVSGEERQQRDRHNSLDRFIAWLSKRHPEILRVNEVTLRIASEYWKSLEMEGKSASTRNNNLSALNTIWSAIHAPMELSSNPWSAIKRDQGGSIRYQPFTKEEMTALRETAKTFSTSVEPGFWPTAIEIGYYTGLRLGDIATLDWSELSQTENYLVLTPNKTKHWGNDRVAVHSLALPWVQMLPPRQTEGLLWPKAADLYKTPRLSAEFAELAKAAGIQIDREPAEGERRIRDVKLKTFHSLRHTFATEMLKAGVSEEELRDQGNWSGTEVINQHYNHAKFELAKAAADKIAATINQEKKS